MLYPTLQKHCEEYLALTNWTAITRPKTLQRLVDYLTLRLKAGQAAQVLVVCTHNARRSQIAQYWLAVGAAYFGLETLFVYSGGTEVTAVHPHTAAALQRMGLSVVPTDVSLNNPPYQVRWNDTMQALPAYSKHYKDALLLEQDFVALLVCDTEACPHIPGAVDHIALPYEDPSIWDHSPEQMHYYDQTVRSIGMELLWVLQQTTQNL